MMFKKMSGAILPALALALAAGNGTALAAGMPAGSDIKAIQKRVDRLQKELDATKRAADRAAQLADTAQREATAADSDDIKWRFAGSVAANYGSNNMKGSSDTFTGGSFMPIFLVRYKDLLELEAHMEVANNGSETKTSLEYAQLDLFATDWATIVAGKFLSPLGQFQQAIHPPWINKLPTVRQASWRTAGPNP